MPGEKYSCTEKKYLSWRITLEKILHRCMSGKHSITRGLRKKNYCTNQITHTPTPHSPQNSNGIAAFDFVSMLRKRRTKENKAANQNLRYVIYNIYIKLYIIFPQEIKLGK